MSHSLNIAILGASGYTGAELIRLLCAHPHAKIRALSGDSQAGKSIGAVYPHLAHLGLPDLVALSGMDYTGIDLVFCCLPHGTTQSVIAGLPKQVRVVDLSADFRLSNPQTYAQWYGHAHQAEDLQQEAVYGLTEHARAQVKSARLVANPGCYPTCALLPLLPLLKAGAIRTDDIIIDAKSGVTGAGRSVKQANLFSEISDGFSAYGVGSHRHTPEIEQELSHAAGKAIQVRFTPHLVPMNRGMLATIYVTPEKGNKASDLRAILAKAYEGEAFVFPSPEGTAPATQQVRGTNNCIFNIFEDRIPGKAVIVSVIDNLCKGASGQAVQNMNARFGVPETTGLSRVAMFP
jgi:N-acetyl-gamma-glutamyl-phosphate reductase